MITVICDEGVGAGLVQRATYCRELMRNVIALAYEYSESRLFYSDIQRGSINTVHFNGSGHEVLLERECPCGSSVGGRSGGGIRTLTPLCVQRWARWRAWCSRARAARCTGRARRACAARTWRRCALRRAAAAPRSCATCCACPPASARADSTLILANSEHSVSLL